MSFGLDFINMLKEYGRLPITSLRKSMDMLKENEERNKQIEELEKANNVKATLL